MCDCHPLGIHPGDDDPMYRCLNCGDWNDTRYCNQACADEHREAKKMTAFVQAGGGGYGARVFIPYAYMYPAVINHLGRVCKWGGSDKDTGLCASWEVPDNVPGHKPMQELISYLEGYGYQVHKVGAGNYSQVWK